MKVKNIFDTLSNLVFKKTRNYSLLKPKILTITFTGMCNAHCIMCNIWKRKDASKTDLSLKEYKEIFEQSRLLKSISIINVTGGEPFMRKDIVEFVKFIIRNCPNLEEIRFASNGLMPELISKRMKEIVKLKCRFNIKISIDGIGEVHNKIRGNKNAFKLAEKTINSLAKLSRKNRNLNVALAHTVMPENYDELPKLMKHFKGKGIDIIPKIVYHAKSFNNKEKSISFDKKQKKNILENLFNLLRYQENKIRKTARGWRRLKQIAYYLYTKYQYDLLMGKKVYMPCHSTFSSITIESDGKVYSCGIMYGLLGDLKKEPFDKIWLSKKNKKLRDFINDGKCRCTNACDTIPSLMMDNFIPVLRKLI
jgi:MoaA/NifB/PqqE/SkfB family radical SAM enzyme